MIKRERLEKIANETLQIVKRGYYKNDKNEQKNIANKVEQLIQNTVLYTPKSSNDLLYQIKPKRVGETIIEVTNESTLQAIKRMKDDGVSKVIALNFASAKNPGGGFLKGSSAQEESLARSSALYESLLSKMEMYEYNRNLKTCLYSDHIIYSPDVPVFRNDEGYLLDEPYLASFITAPAVNAGVVRSKESQAAKNQIHIVMKKRIEKVLSIGIYHGYESIVLGAFGCGVFKNNPKDVANYFKELIQNSPKLKNQYKQIVFAVLDFSEGEKVYEIFKNTFK